jgi:hypothetical protein
MVHWGTDKCVPPLPQDDRDGDWRTHFIGWASVVGLSSITEANVEEWLWRLTFLSDTVGWEAAALAYGRKEGGHKKVFVTLPILRRWVGLWTNWSNVKRKEWVKLRVERLEEGCDATVRLALKEEEAAPVSKPKRKARSTKGRK